MGNANDLVPSPYQTTFMKLSWPAHNARYKLQYKKVVWSLIMEIKHKL